MASCDKPRDATLDEKIAVLNSRAIAGAFELAREVHRFVRNALVRKSKHLKRHVRLFEKISTA